MTVLILKSCTRGGGVESRSTVTVTVMTDIHGVTVVVANMASCVLNAILFLSYGEHLCKSYVYVLSYVTYAHTYIYPGIRIEKIIYTYMHTYIRTYIHVRTIRDIHTIDMRTYMHEVMHNNK